MLLHYRSYSSEPYALVVAPRIDVFAYGSLVTTNGEALGPIEELHPELPTESAIISIGSCRDTSSCLTPEWNVHVANVSVAIILISAAASIGVFKQTYKVIWTVLLAYLS